MKNQHFKSSDRSMKNFRWTSKAVCLSLLLTLIIIGCGHSGEIPTEAPPLSGDTFATLSWDAPTTTNDGSPLTALSSYKIYYATTSPVTDANSSTVLIDNPLSTTANITDLSPGTYYFAVTAIDDQGIESGMSSEVTKTIT